MKGSKLLVLLSTFTKAELKEFNKFVSSPFFNNRKEVIPFFNHLQKLAPDFPDKNVGREAVYKQVFPGRPYSEQHLQKLMNYLLKLAEKYIGQKAMQEDYLQEEYYILKGMQQRSLSRHFAFLLKRVQSRLPAVPLRNSNFFRKQFLFSQLASFEQHSQNNMRSYNENLQESSNLLDLFYLAEKLKHSCAMVNNQRYVKDPYDLGLLAAAEEMLNEEKYARHPVINTYAHILQLLQQKQPEQNLRVLLQSLEQFLDYFDEEERLSLHYYGINHYSDYLKSGEERFLEKTLDLYMSGLENGSLLPHGQLAYWDFKNIIKLATGLKKYDWIEDFIHQYHPKLPAEHREDALHFNLAALHFHKKEFEKAMDQLTLVTYSDIYYQLDSKAMLLKIYYESGEFEAVQSMLPAYNMLIRRTDQIHPSTQQSFLNFCKILRQLAREKINSLPKIRESIENSPRLRNRHWLQAMLEAREQAFSTTKSKSKLS